MSKSKRRKVVKIEDIVRDKKDFLTYQHTGYTELRIKNSGKKLDRSSEDRLAFNARGKNHCITCDKGATKVVYLAIKGGGSQIQRYCPRCFDRFIDVQKMELKSFDNFHILENIKKDMMEILLL